VHFVNVTKEETLEQKQSACLRHGDNLRAFASDRKAESREH
jgi:hypothetical protein